MSESTHRSEEFQFSGDTLLVVNATMLDDGKFASMVDGFLQKPYEIGDIAERIRSILDGGDAKGR